MIGRHIVDLNGYGKEFYNCIRNFSLGYRVDDPGGQKEREKFIYHESANQIFMFLDTNVQAFMNALQTLPNMEQFKHIPDLFLPERYQIFAEQFRMFAFGLAQMTFSKVPVDSSMDYLLETITESYMIVLVQPKATGQVYDLL